MTGFSADELSVDGAGWTPPTLEQWRAAQREDDEKRVQVRPKPADLIEAIRPSVGVWMLDAACKGSDPAMFTKPTDGGIAAEAICATCPVRKQCLEWVLTQPQLGRAGIVAGGHLWTSKGKPTKRHPRKPCKRCGAEFQPLRLADVYCCEVCRVRANPHKRSLCQGCGKPLPPRQGRGSAPSKWCSNACCCRGYYERNLEAQRQRKRAAWQAAS